MGSGGLPGNAIDKPRKFTVDERFTAHFRNLKQVFMYINDDCNLSCEQCIYKPHVKYHDGREIQLVDALGLLSSFHEMGAFKVTFLGGEPTLYGRRDRGRPLGKLIDGARGLGYSHVRLDTNGQFAPAMFDVGGLARLDEIAFSIDGFDAQSNDLLRGEGSFAVATTRLRLAVRRGIRTSITCCIHDGLVRPGLDGTTGVEKVIAFAQAAGAEVINFHDLFKAGVPMDTWTGSFDTSVEDHVRMYDRVRRRIENHEFSIDVRLPQCFVTKAEFERDPAYYGYCPVKLGERVMVHSDGVIRICSNLICTSFGTGRFEGDQILWNATASNETLKHDLSSPTPCTNRSKNMSYGDFVPLCFSFKPNQVEPSWRALDWDARRQVSLTPDSSVAAASNPGPAHRRRRLPIAVVGSAS